MRFINWVKDGVQQAKIACGILDKKVYTGPWHVQIDLTNVCNNDCLACWCNSPLLEEKAMRPEIRTQTLPLTVVLQLIDDLDGLGVRDIYFTGGGEPFMHPDILTIMRHVKAKGMRLDMSTNFTLVTKEIAQTLVELEVDHLNMSLWAASPEAYVALHPNKTAADFQRMIEVIDYIHQLKVKKQAIRPALGMYNVITARNYHEVAQMLEFAQCHRINDISYVPVDTVPGKTDQLKLSAQAREELQQVVAGLPELQQQLAVNSDHHVVFANLEVFGSRLASDGADAANYDSNLLQQMDACYAGWSFARILATGDVNSCLKSFKIPIGNVHENRFPEIWFGRSQQEFRQHTIEYRVDDPYLLAMGNDLATENQGCIKCCDNIGLNSSIQAKLDELNIFSRTFIRLVNKIKR